jgi:hypothetical protein
MTIRAHLNGFVSVHLDTHDLLVRLARLLARGAVREAHGPSAGTSKGAQEDTGNMQERPEEDAQ